MNKSTSAQRLIFALIATAAGEAALADTGSASTAANTTATAPGSTDTSSAVVYGVLDVFVGHMSANGTTLNALDDNGTLVSRVGFRGLEKLDEESAVKYDLETGINPVTGAQKDANRLFDRQAWVSYKSNTYGELRAGRQNTRLFLMGDDVDASQRSTFASFINNTGILARVDNDISYLSPKIAGFYAEIHHAMGGQAGSTNGGSINQVSLEYRGTAIPIYVFAYDVNAKPFSGETYTESVNIQSYTVNYDYGYGKVYFTRERSNNITGFGAGQALSNVGSYPISSSPVASNPGPYYIFNQGSVDYRPTSNSSIGVIYGTGTDESGKGNDVKGGGLVGMYDVTKRTRYYATYAILRNSNDAVFKFSGAGAPVHNLPNSAVEGQSIRGFQLGIRFIF